MLTPARDDVGGLRLALTGDVMLGRGVDQIMRHPVDPEIHERWMASALGYVDLAEARSGPIPRRVGPTYVWGDALATLDELDPDVLVVNLETAVTDRGTPWPGKGIQYRMSPAHVDTLVAAGVDVACLANNHVLDWSVPGLEQTLDVLADAGITPVGAGRTRSEAWAPAAVELDGDRRLLVWAMGSPTAGIPPDWEATEDRAGVALLPDLSDTTVDELARRIADVTRPGDVVVVSVHWGGNWGYEIEPARCRFARSLIDRAGVHLVHGHSSHHPIGMEIHGGHLVLHGCGDLVTDYEGITGHEQYRGELGAVYLPRLDPATGALVELDLLPTRVERFRLGRPSPGQRQWLVDTLVRESGALGTTLSLEGDTLLSARW
jgi:poly-gamma-glutamate synthesis protein (capsule biosynthesis protein)